MAELSSRELQLFGISEEAIADWSRTGNQIALEAWLDDLIGRGLISRSQAFEIINEINILKNEGYWETIGRPQFAQQTEALRFDRLRRQQVDEANIGRVQEQRAREARATFQEGVEPLRPVSELISPVLERIRSEVSPSAARFFERELPRLFEAGGFAEKRREFQERRSRFIPEARGIGDPTGLSAEEQIELEAPVLEREEELAGQRALVDPFETFLKEFNFKERFAGLTPREKGQFSGQFRPRTRFLG